MDELGEFTFTLKNLLERIIIFLFRKRKEERGKKKLQFPIFIYPFRESHKRVFT